MTLREYNDVTVLIEILLWYFSKEILQVYEIMHIFAGKSIESQFFGDAISNYIIITITLQKNNHN